MPIYEYRCKPCGSQEEVVASMPPSAPPDCFDCGQVMTRKFSVSLPRPMQEHWNYTTGSPISDQRQFNRELRILGEQRTERTGIPHSYVPVDASDYKGLGGTETEATEKNTGRKDQSGGWD